MEGTVEKSTLRYIIRDHDGEKFRQKKERMMDAAAYLNAKYGAGTVNITIRDSYFNMRQVIEPCMFVVDRAKKAIEDSGIQPIVVPIRGGTDGARLSYVGLPCPNLGTGGENYHGRYEYACVEDMELSTRVLINILTAGK
jgi:tripeptide aminopeptidase